MDRRLIIGIVGGTAVLFLLIGFIWFLRNRDIEPVTPTQQVPGQAVQKPVAEEVPTGPPDVDGDGIPDANESQYKTDSQKYDTDEDGLSDGFEVQSGTDPLTPRKPPSRPSNVPITPTVTTPSDTAPTTPAPTDADNDGLTNIQEEQLGSNPNNPDTDGDGFKDGDEVKAGYNPNGPGKLPQ